MSDCKLRIPGAKATSKKKLMNRIRSKELSEDKKKAVDRRCTGNYFLCENMWDNNERMNVALETNRNQ